MIGKAILITMLIHAQGEPGEFKHHFVDRHLPGSAWGQTALVDIDQDGDLDFITGRRGGEIRWYEFQKDEQWQMHVIGENSPSDVGGAVLDVNGDGRPDFVTGGAWYEHPQDRTQFPWKRHVFDADLRQVHDLITADIDGDGKTDVITMSDKNDLRWYQIAEDPTEPWKHQKIGRAVHAGIAAGDLDGDGDIDLVRSGYWLENIDSGKSWTEHKFCEVSWADEKSYPEAARSVVADINQDGRLDIILTEAEFAGGRVAWFENPQDAQQVPWTMHVMPHSDDEKRGPYHTLQVADFDNDGDLDIFSGEMEHLARPPHRWFIWENIDRGKEFKEHVILDMNLGTHEAVAGDIDGDGDIDLIGKLWRPVPDNANEGRNHVDYVENLLIP